ncbi:malectin domain-containing carbohydrate-binding protein [Maribacter sp. 2307UL18-2]|uniref:malectin domain-containing carbohydrate-binding protein n=1 Tax=Maribacter sp. 2307UL18-2 TaxID=3386274 RepID=UPI0039BCF2DC
MKKYPVNAMMVESPTLAIVQRQNIMSPMKWVGMAITALFLMFLGVQNLSAQSFGQSNLNFDGNGGVNNGTSLMYGPDGRLYVLSLNGTIDIFTVQKNGNNDYVVTASEELLDVKNIPNHNDDGSNTSGDSREATGLTVAGTATNPIMYVTSSDSRVGGPAGDKNLDTNSGVITRLTWTGSEWDVVDIVRGLPRSEENHATNGLEFVTIGTTDFLIVASGGHANAGAPSDNFAWTTEYALSAAVLSVNLTMLEAITPMLDGGRKYLYDLPTLDDPTRPNVGPEDPDAGGYTGIDVNDPWGGNDGLNQAMIVEGGPVQIFSAGYRNSYDLAVTESGAVYVTDNGANGGWGGLPEGEGTANVTNNYNPAEPGSSSPVDGEQVDNQDHLSLVTTDIQNYNFGSFYGGHPAPIRANPEGAGLYTNPSENNTVGAVFRTKKYDPTGTKDPNIYTSDASIALPANWPPVPVGLADVRQGDWRGPTVFNPDGPQDVLVTTWQNNSNGIDEYTSTIFTGEESMVGDLIVGRNSNNVKSLHRVELQPDGSLENLTQNFISNLGGNPLGITCNSDTDPFPGTIWVATFNGTIKIFEPEPNIICIDPTDPLFVETDDTDLDGYANLDEVQNGVDHCNGGAQPTDFDKDAGGTLVSDLNDTDDDNDGILDKDDVFQLGDPTDSGSDAFDLPVLNDLLSDNPVLKGISGLGMTGFMNNGAPNPNWLDWLDVLGAGPNPNDIVGGAVGAMTLQMTDGTALGTTNDQDKGYQYGVNVDQSLTSFTVEGRLLNFTDPLQLYGSSAPTNGELGLFIGDGTQSNYIKFVVNQTGLQALQEINDVPQAPIELALAPGDRPNGSMTIFFTIDPATGIVTLQYKINGGTMQTLGDITAQGAVLNAIQQSNNPLAVGLIGSSNTVGAEVEGTWDYLYVQASQPTIQQPIPDSSFLVGETATSYSLDEYFSDDGGDANLVYSVFSNTNVLFDPQVNNNILDVSLPNEAATTEITIRATDGAGLFVDQTFTVTISDEPIPIIRIRANGASITATDAPNPNWQGITATGAQSGTSNGIGYSVNGGNHSTHNIAGRDASLPDYVPQAIFANERWDPPAGAEMLWNFTLPDGDYFVRLYMGNGFDGTSTVGTRVFDISIEGVLVQNDIDLITEFGDDTGGMKEYQVTATGGDLTILFEHVVENPLINGIEILSLGGTFTPPLAVDAIPNQASSVGALVNLDIINASGGDSNENFMYSATGLPPGLEIEPTTGNINGTIEANADAGSPYTVEITVDKTSSDAVSTTFSWTVNDGSNPGGVVYRVNTGGGLTSSNDSSPVAWEEDQKSAGSPGNIGGNAVTGTPSPYVNFATQDLTFGADLPGGFVNSTGYPNALFATERYNSNPVPDNMKWSFPTGNGTFQVNLLFNENWANENAETANNRIFDVEIEGALVLDNYRPSVDGSETNIAKVESFQTIVDDGTLNIDFIQINQNPAIKGIEIIAAAPPVNDEWTAQTDDENHTARHECSFVQAGDKFYLFGGRENPADLDVYDYQSKTWSTIGSSAPSDFNHFQAVEYNGLIWVIGAFKDNDFPNEVPADFVWTYNPATDDWVQGPAVPNARKRGSAGLVMYNNKFYVIAGNADGHDGQYVPWFDEFDPATGIWTTLADAPRARDHFHAGVIDDKLYVAGGRLSGGPGGTFSPLIAEVDVFDFSAGTWSTLPAGQNIPTPRAAASVAVFQDELYVIGGEIENDLDGNLVDDAVTTTESFNPATGNWTSRADLITERHGTQAIVSGNGIHVTAGSSSKGGGGTMKNMEFFGTDNPQGTPLVAGVLTLPADITVPTGGTETVSITHSSGNAAVIITSIQLGGTNASEFSISSNTGFGLINPGETVSVSIVHTGSSQGETASLVVAYDDGKSVNSPIVSGEAIDAVLYRINAGGALVVDAAGDFEEDQSAASAGGSANTGTPSPYVNTVAPAVDNTFGSNAALAQNTTGYPDAVFQTERWSDAANPNNMNWSFPTGDGTFRVNLLFNENWADENAAPANNRIFDVEIEDVLVLDDYRPSGDGSDVNIAKVESFLAIVNDGTLNIDFIKGNQNPAIKGIEILSVTPTTGGGPLVTNPGAQVSVEGDVINLPIVALDGTSPPCGPLTYTAENLPENLTIDETTGVISGTLLEGTGSGTAGAFIEENGLVVIEMESTDNLPGSWVNAANATSPNITSPENATGDDFIVWEAGQFLGQTGVSTITYPVEITTTGVYQFKWRTQVGNGTSSTDHNDTWLKIEGDAFYGQKGNGSSIVCPKGFNGSTNDCTGNAPQGAGGNGWFKVFSSGSTNWTWSTLTSDNDGHQIFARFDNPGTYNILISVRSSNHALDRMVLAHSGFSGNEQNLSLPESERAVGQVQGASADSPYDVIVNVADACDPQGTTQVEFTWNVTATEIGNPSATVGVTTGSGLTSSTFGNNSFVIQNTGDDEIVNVTLDMTSGFMKDVVFDPVGTAGDSTAKCLSAGSNPGGPVGLTAGADGSGQDDCVDIFTQFHNGIDDEEGYDIMSLDFTDFNPGETFSFGVDMDPTTIKGDLTAGDAGSISGFELIGATISIQFASGVVYTSSLFDEGSLGGSDVIINGDSNALIAPSILVDGLATSRLVTDANHLVEVTGSPNSSITLLRVDGRLYIDPGNPSVGYDIDLFEANQALAKELYTVQLGPSGVANIPVTLTQTPGATNTPDGGLNHFIAVVNGPNGENSIASNVIVLEYDPDAIIGPAVLIEMTPGADLDTSTFTAGSMQITNNSSGALQITNVTIDLSTGILPDMVFDPLGNGGDATAKCFEASTGATAVGLVVPTDPCATPFSQPRNGGFDVMSIDFKEFDPGEIFTFATDIDPNSIQAVPGAGAAGSVSGFEVVGATVTISFSDGSNLTTSIYEDGSLGGGQAIAALDTPVTPSISVVGTGVGPATVNSLNQVVTVTGTPGDVVSLMVVDSRLYIAQGGDPFNVPDPTYYANEAMAKSLYTGLIGTGGSVDIPIELLQTSFGNGTPDGGLNQLVAVTSSGAYAPDKPVSNTSNVVTLLYDPNAVDTGDLTLSYTMQGRTDLTTEMTVEVYEQGASVPSYQFTPTGSAGGEVTVSGIEAGTYEVAVKVSNYLQRVTTVTIVAGANTASVAELRAGDANNDNFVTLQDFSILAGTFNLQEGGAGYDPRADFNGDGFVTLVDFSLLASNFNTQGEEVP